MENTLKAGEVHVWILSFQPLNHKDLMVIALIKNQKKIGIDIDMEFITQEEIRSLITSHIFTPKELNYPRDLPPLDQKLALKDTFVLG